MGVIGLFDYQKRLLGQMPTDKKNSFERSFKENNGMRVALTVLFTAAAITCFIAAKGHDYKWLIGGGCLMVALCVFLNFAIQNNEVISANRITKERPPVMIPLENVKFEEE